MGSRDCRFCGGFQEQSSLIFALGAMAMVYFSER